MRLSENAMVVEHPLIEHKISVLRDKNTTVKEFRETVGEIASLLCYEACRDIATDVVEIETPVAKTTGRKLKKKNISIVPILRAGIGMVDGILNLIPTAEIGHIGLYRDPETLKPVEYYCNLPSNIEEKSVLLVDPMLATGGSAVAAVDFLKEKGVKDIRFLCIIAAPEGMKKLCETHGDVKVYCAAYDKCLNDHGYIVPGLGDAGDRIFGTF